MKKLLSILSVVSLTATGASSVIACGVGKAKSVKQPIPLKETQPEKNKQPETQRVGQTQDVVETSKKQKIINISLNSIKELSDRKVREVPYLNFKLPINLYNNLETNTLSRKTKEEKTIIFNNVENFIKNFVKEKINDKILEINNSLTKNDYNIIFLYPDSIRQYNPRYKSIAMDFTVEGKNKATGQVTQKLTVDVSAYSNTY